MPWPIRDRAAAIRGSPPPRRHSGQRQRAVRKTNLNGTATAARPPRACARPTLARSRAPHGALRSLARADRSNSIRRTSVHLGVRAHRARSLAHKGVQPHTARQPRDVNPPTPPAWPPAARIAKPLRHYARRPRDVRGAPQRYVAARRELQKLLREEAAGEAATRSLQTRAGRVRA
jgi:hypothetical protein